MKHTMQAGIAAALFAAPALFGVATPAGAQALSPDADAGSVTAAEPVEPSAAGKTRWTVGLGPALLPEYEGSDDYRATLFPVVRAQKDYIYGQLLGLRFRSNLINDPNWRLGPSMRWRRGYSDVSNKRVDDLNNREGSFEIGASGGYDFTFGKSAITAGMEFTQDVSGGHNGFVLTPALTYRGPLAPKWDFSINGDFSVASGGYMDHYFSVNSRDSRDSGLKEYNADADVKDTSFTVTIGYQFAEAWRLQMLGQYRRMLGDAADSPIVDDEGNPNNLFGGVIVSYTW